MNRDVPMPEYPNGIGNPTEWARGVIAGGMRLNRLLYRPEFIGAENLPTDRPFMLVSNHNAGMALAELGSFFGLWQAKYADRPITGLAHTISFRVPPLRWALAQLGAIPSTYEGAHAALSAGVPVLIFPGGDHDSLRPIWEYYKVDFNGRRGFLRIAQEHNVPIVPMAIRGSHFTAPMLFRANWLAKISPASRLGGIKRWGVSLSGLIGIGVIMSLRIDMRWRIVLALLWSTMPFQFLPHVPWKITFHIGEAIKPEDLFTDGDPELRSALKRVEDTIAGMMRD